MLLWDSAHGDDEKVESVSILSRLESSHCFRALLNGLVMCRKPAVQFSLCCFPFGQIRCFFQPLGASTNILQEFDDDEHPRHSLFHSHSQKPWIMQLTKIQSLFSPTFSDKALRYQEPWVSQSKYWLIPQFNENCGETLGGRRC
jgi:hypothetical protein